MGNFYTFKIFITLSLLCYSLFTSAQNVGINSTGNVPAASAGLDVDFQNKGMLIPRVVLTSVLDVSTIPSPANSLLIYNSATAGVEPNNVIPGYYYFSQSDSQWHRLATGMSVKWSAVGDSIYFSGAGGVAIGADRFDLYNPEKFLVDVGTEGSINAISARGTNSSYVQINVQNRSNGEGASSDLVATNDTGDEEHNYINMGINSSGNNAEGTLGGPNKAYLFSTGDDFVIGNGTPNKNLTFYSTTIKAGDTLITEKMRLNSTGVTFSQSLKKLTYSNNNYTLGIDDYTIICDPINNMTINLPDAVAFSGRVFYIKNPSNKAVTISAQAGQTIDGVSSKTINKQYGGIMVQSDGLTWYVIIADLG